MIALSTAPVRFTPSWQLGDDGAPLPGAAVFFVRPGSLIDRGVVESELAGPPYNAGRVYPWDFANAAEAAARELLDGDHRGLVLEAWAALRASAFDIARLDAEAQQLLTAIEPALCLWPDYGELRRAEARRNELLPMLCAKLFVTGWEHGEAVFAAGRDGRVTDAALMQLPLFEMRAVGMFAWGLMQAEHHRPLSPPPSKSAPPPPLSKVAGPRRSAAKAGKSTAPSGNRTRA